MLDPSPAVNLKYTELLFQFKIQVSPIPIGKSKSFGNKVRQFGISKNIGVLNKHAQESAKWAANSLWLFESY